MIGRTLGSSCLLIFLAVTSSARAETVRYVHTDALGSPVAYTNELRNVVAQKEYEPYGKQTAGGVDNKPGYTGHVTDSSTELAYMQQRYNDPLLGRFTSPDPLAALSDPIKHFNRYRYASNNPYRFVDPDGRADDDPRHRPGPGMPRVYPPPPPPPDKEEEEDRRDDQEGEVRDLEGVVVIGQRTKVRKGAYINVWSPNFATEGAAAYGGGTKIKHDWLTGKSSAGIVFLGLGAKGDAGMQLTAGSFDIFTLGYNWGVVDAPVDIEIDAQLLNAQLSIVYDPGSGAKISLNAGVKIGAYVGGAVMFDDTLVEGP